MASLKDIEAWAEREALLEPGDSEVGQGAIEGPRVVRLGDVASEYPIRKGNETGQNLWRKRRFTGWQATL